MFGKRVVLSVFVVEKHLLVDLAVGLVSVWLDFGYDFAEAPDGLALDIVGENMATDD